MRRQELHKEKTDLLSLIFSKLSELNHLIDQLDQEDEDSQASWDQNFGEFQELGESLFSVDQKLKELGRPSQNSQVPDYWLELLDKISSELETLNQKMLLRKDKLGTKIKDSRRNKKIVQKYRPAMVRNPTQIQDYT